MNDEIKNMLCENTGKHFMDSGGENGRMWQINAKRDITKLPEFYFIGDSLIINTYHWLHERVEYMEGFTTQLHEYFEKADEWDYMAAREWVEEIGGELEGDVVYTYNCENQLSQDVQFSLFRLGKKYYVVLQSHNGADARGGMSTPRVFRVKDDSYCMFDFSFLSLQDEDGETVKPWDAEEVDGVIRERETGKELHVCMYDSCV